MFEKYFEEELNYLYESGREFARAHPDRAKYLNIDAVGDRDPYVERLFEGFAFLSARIKEKLDDSLPEITEGILRLIAPQFLLEYPSLSITRFTPRSGFLQKTKVIPAGSEILSSETGVEKTICRFRTTQDVKINPVSLKSVDKETDTKNNTKISFSFQIEPGVEWDQLDLEPLTLYIHSEFYSAMNIHKFLTGTPFKAGIELNNSENYFSLDPSACCRPSGFDIGQSLMPAGVSQSDSYNLLLEYFIFPEKYLFFDIKGLSSLGKIDYPVEKFKIILTYNDEFPQSINLDKNIFRLFCSPIINMFKKETEPLTHTGLRSEHQIIADSSKRNSCRAHSVISVNSVEKATGKISEYSPLFTDENISDKDKNLYSESYREGYNGRRDLFLNIRTKEEAQGKLQESSLSIEAWCTNGEIPREHLREGGISHPGRGFPESVSIKNITRPTLPVSPPSRKDYYWSLLSHINSTYNSLGSSEKLKSILELYNWPQTEAKKRMTGSIQKVETEPQIQTINGGIIRGIKYRVHVLSSEFGSSGDIHLFGTILNEFLQNYASVNSFIRLEIIQRPSGKVLSWKPSKGIKCPI